MLRLRAVMLICIIILIRIMLRNAAESTVHGSVPPGPSKAMAVMSEHEGDHKVW